jgi:hypothetical protein
MEAAEIKYFTPTDQRGKRKHGSFSLHTILLTSFVHDADGTQMRKTRKLRHSPTSTLSLPS